MKRVMVFGMALVVSLSLFGCASGQQATNTNLVPLTKADITALSRAGVSDSVIVAMLTSSHTHLSLNAQDVIALADSGVSENVISAMVKLGKETEPANQSHVAYAYPWFPYDWYPYHYWYDPFWNSWYYPRYSVSLGFYGGHVGHGGGHRRVR